MSKQSALPLSKEDLLVLFNSLMNPPKPNDKLKAAAKLHKRVTRKRGST